LLLLGCEEAGKDTASTENVDSESLDDLDRDGITAEEGDCDDSLVAINPSATDIVGDGIDQNCDGIDGTDSDGDGIASTASGIQSAGV